MSHWWNVEIVGAGKLPMLLCFLAFVVIKLALGKIRAIHPLMWVASAMFLVYFLLGPIREALGL